MKNKIYIIFLFAHSLIFSQDEIISGVIVNKDRQPIFGVSVSKGGRSLCFTNDKGEFSFILINEKIEGEINFTHLSYISEAINVNEIKEGFVQVLEEKVNDLDEVIISTYSKKSINIIKEATKKFKEEYRVSPYWSSLNFKQIINLNGKSHSYLELEGHILMIGEDSNPFITPLVVPNKIRRTKENIEVVNSWFANSNKKSFFKAQLGSNQATAGWVDYRFFEVAHPLGKKGKQYFNFKLIEIQDIDDVEYYVFDYTQRKEINIIGRWLDYTHGKLWINKNDLSLLKIETSYRFERISFVGFNIYYKKIEEKLFPYSIEKNSFKFRTFKSNKSRIVLNSLSVFNNIDLVVRENYRYKFSFGPWYKVSEKYDKEYWKGKDIIKLKYKNALYDIAKDKTYNEVFLEGANTKEYNNSLDQETLHYFNVKGDELIAIMKIDLKL